MILGILDRAREGPELKQDLLRAAAQLTRGRTRNHPTVWANRQLALCWIPQGINTLDETHQPFVGEGQTIVVMFEGNVYNIAEIERSLSADRRFRADRSGEILLHLYEKLGVRFPKQLNGKFAFALWDERNQRLVLGRDHFGIEPLFYSYDGQRLIFSSSLRSLLATGLPGKRLNHEAVLQYLLYCYNPGDETFVRNVYKLPAGHFLSVDSAGLSISRYWNLSFAETKLRSDDEYRVEILDLITDAVRLRLDPRHPPGVFLSGGTDSSTIVSLTSKMCGEPLRTFSFRCEGRSYDESSYARLVAGKYGTQHTEIPYLPDHLSKISEMVEAMDEPFCDIGIEIATYLLGQAAQREVRYVFSGEGGDELFGGHPVYVADKVAAVIDRLPRAILNPLAWLSQSIPDSDEKKNVQVKLKRFAYSLSFPPELLSNRWRIYYTPQELRSLCTSDFVTHWQMKNMFDGMLKYARQADGRDQLSRSLYSDYHTLVDFYLRRLGLLRALAIESRLPLLDYRLVEYAAQIPSSMKIRGFSDTKYIYRRVLQGIVPDEILYNRPKLGHSVPMKNWLRDNAKVREWAVAVLTDRSFTNRGYFAPAFVQRMLAEHARKTHNHSHRIWGLIVLALWLRASFGA